MDIQNPQFSLLTLSFFIKKERRKTVHPHFHFDISLLYTEPLCIMYHMWCESIVSVGE